MDNNDINFLKYKKWLLTRKKIPKSTRMYRRAIAKKAQNECPMVQSPWVPDEATVSHESTNDNCKMQDNEPYHSAAEVHQVAVNNATSTDTSEEIEKQSIGCSFNKRKRKPKRKYMKRGQFAVIPSSSSDEPESDASERSNASNHSASARTVQEEIQDPMEHKQMLDITEDEEECENVYFKPRSSRTSVPLCPCTDITADDVVLMTLVLGLRHGLSWVAQVDILKLVSNIFKNSDIPLSKTKYLKELHSDQEIIEYNIFCDTCDSYLGIRNTRKEKSKNQSTVDAESNDNSDRVKHCSICNKNVDVMSPSNFFVSLSISQQLQNFLKDDKFVNLILTHRFNRKITPNVYSDIYDGKRYRELSAEGGVLFSKYNFSYTFFTDGVAYGKSSNKTIWPIYLTVNELPYEERANYVILAGVYAGSKDPNQSYFLKPFVSAANKLSTEGISWIHNGHRVTSLFIPFCCVADSVARYQILNYQSFYARFGCTFCYKQGIYLHGGIRFPLSAFEGPAEERTPESMISDLSEVYERRHETQEKNRVYRGVKGPCNLMSLQHFDITSCFVVDYMHAVLLGVVKTHTEFMLEPTRKKMWIGMTDERIGMNHLISSIDNNIKQIQSNSSVIRELRPLKDRALWRASEYKAWLLHYCIPCLSGLLKDKYLAHLAMLSKAIFILLQQSITYEEVNEAHELITLYSYFFQKYFGEENMVYNIHLLSHIAKMVLEMGPIWGHNRFPFESENRHLLQLCKSPFSVAFQIARKYVIYKRLPSLCNELAHSGKTLTYSQNICDYKKLVRYDRGNDNNCVLLGKATVPSLTNSYWQIVSNKISPYACAECLCYQRMIFKRKLYSAAVYSDGKQNNDSCVVLRDGKCVIIKYIIKTPIKKVLLLVQKVNVKKEPLISTDQLKLNHVKTVQDLGETMCIDLELISEPFLLMHTVGHTYVAQIPYGSTVE